MEFIEMLVVGLILGGACTYLFYHYLFPLLTPKPEKQEACSSSGSCGCSSDSAGN